MTTGPDSGPADAAGPRDWGAWPDVPEAGRSGAGRRGGGRSRRSRRDQPDAWGGSEAEDDRGPTPSDDSGHEPGDRSDTESRGRGRRESRRGGKRSQSSRPGILPDGPVDGSPASQGPPADPRAVARAICLRLLTMAPRTRAQLAEALRKREVPDEAAEAVLERFSEVGLIDDEAFAAAWVSSRHAGRGLARRALASELRHRGVDEETVKEAMEQLDPEQEVETARRLVARKLPSTRGLDTAVRTRRLAGMLARKGYGPGLAFRVVREALESEEAENPAFSAELDYPPDE
ncbi:recombination regulator RecX [Streptosporangium sp. NBC_01639]|uniref:recombination regulator RecX n=1 Tax=Streptosporangium sp. NBC_01639 TaxID=2975948 RepID=UPI00386C8124|nr:recombination regulator RecX [Streptosporangium sp. NBC_01639]